MKIKKYLKIITFSALALFTFGCFIPNNLSDFDVYASVKDKVEISNGDFANNPSATYIQTSPYGWSKVTNSSATSGVINVNSDTFENSTYHLDKNPGKNSTKDIIDDSILMINSDDGSTDTAISNKNQGYVSNTINLNANSYYEISILAYTQDNSYASIYLKGLEDYEDKANTKFEKFSTNNSWKEFKFYIATEKSKDITIELWLGTDLTSNIASPDAVFFDEVNLYNISNDLFNSDTITNKKVIDYKNPNIVPVTNSDFELKNLTNWVKTENSDNLGGIGNVLNISTLPSQGLEDFGSDLQKNNKYALVISNQNASSVGFKLSTPIDIAWGEYLKVSINVKVSSNINGKAFVVLRENDDVITFLENLGLKNDEIIDGKDYYTPEVNKLSVAENSSNKFINNYQTVTFYIQGHNLYNSSFGVELWLGLNEKEEKETAIGTAVFDNLKVEKISSEDFNSAETSTYVSKVTLKTISEEPSFKNGEFNNFTKEDRKSSYPYTAKDWEVISSNKEQTIDGVININETIYNSIKSNIGNISNPKHISTSINDTNNIMMLWNKNNQYQSITSSAFNISEEKYFNLNFNFKTMATTSQGTYVTVEVLDNNKNVVYIDKNISSDVWTNYSVTIKAEKNTSELYIRISLGDKDNKVTGYLFLDNVRLNETTLDVDYETFIENNKVIDFTSGKFNLKSYEKDANNYYNPLAYNKNVEDGSNDHGKGGIIDAKEDNSITNPNNKNTFKNMLTISTINEVTYSLTSKDTITLEKDKYYQFDIDIKTIFPYEDIIKNKEYKDNYYGAEFSLVNVKDSVIKEIKTNDFKTYTIFVKAVEEATTNLRFAFKSIDNDTQGFAFFDNYKMTEINEATYLNSKEDAKDDNSKLFVQTAKEEEKEDENKDNNKGRFDFLLIPSIIIGLALVIAIVGSILKHVRFKKWTKKKQAEYDRNKTLHRDVIRKEAEEKRDLEVKDVKDQIASISEEMTKLEEANQERLKHERRSAGHRTIDKQTESEFKAYAKKHTALQKKIDALNIKLEDIQTEDYLVKLQNKLFTDNLKNKINGKASLETQTVKVEKEKKTKKQRNKELYSKKKSNK